MIRRQIIRLIATVASARAGRMSPGEAARFGQALPRGAGYIGAGPVVLLFDLPDRWVKADPAPRSISLEELNARLRSTQN